MSDNFEHSLLPFLIYIPFVASSLMLLFCLLAGRIPVRGRTISKHDNPNLYWSILLFFFVVIVAPSLYFAVAR
jgi:hypothetical protein